MFNSGLQDGGTSAFCAIMLSIITLPGLAFTYAIFDAKGMKDGLTWIGVVALPLCLQLTLWRASIVSYKDARAWAAACLDYDFPNRSRDT